ncbi:unnamed protein product [Plutella xylostella]|uniref:(diamondback moth) hypothetical protein n=1 Tax=Plutella xylostella TaxID=51655 RepID=A0A8S4G525_PLUXY|nr:unnamed protein product [Plutella xylostella]
MKISMKTLTSHKHFNMKVAIVVLASIALCLGAPQPRHAFHEHFEDFMVLIREEAGHDLDHIMGHYLEFDDFIRGIEYMRSEGFKNLLAELESLPEFQALVDFLEKDNIDITYFIDQVHTMLDNIETTSNKARHQMSGTDISAFMIDSIGEFPKDKLAALYEKKIAESEEFRTSMENLNSEEFEQIIDALLDNETFKKEAATLATYGFSVEVFVREIKAVFGQ